jgi:hypothetical protein
MYLGTADIVYIASIFEEQRIKKDEEFFTIPTLDSLPW